MQALAAGTLLVLARIREHPFELIHAYLSEGVVHEFGFGPDKAFLAGLLQ